MPNDPKRNAMKRGAKRQTVVVTSVVLGVVSMILMTIMRRSLAKIPLVAKLLRIKSLGLDSMKDFLEIAELNYRIATPEDKMMAAVIDDVLDSSDEGFDMFSEQKDLKPDGVKDEVEVTWDGDESRLYTIFISTEPIVKQILFSEDKIPLLNKTEIQTLRESSNWIRRIVVGYSPPPSKQKEKIPADKTAKRKPGEPLTEDELHSGLTRTSWKIPFLKFYSRLKSSNGRVSKEISYPALKTSLPPKPEVETRLFKAGRDYFLDIKEDETVMKSHIYDYQVVFYVANGQGFRKCVPPFNAETTIQLGHLQPCLCYLIGVREIGAAFEQFVGWIGEEQALNLDGELEKYLDQDFYR